MESDKAHVFLRKARGSGPVQDRYGGSLVYRESRIRSISNRPVLEAKSSTKRYKSHETAG
jgi:hypothetical protein